MKNKKGFTLIEIIISIVLIVMISSITTILLVNKNNDDIDNDAILSAASVYIETEKDEKGNKYIDGIENGGQGAIIPLSDLYEKGYLDKRVYQNAIKLISNEQQYVIAGFFDDCEIGTTLKIAWEDIESIDTTTYICSYNYSNNKKDYDENTIYGKIRKEYDENGIAGCAQNKDSGLCLLKGKNKTDNNSSIYYYAGTAKNNHVKIGNKEFYIVRTTENNNVKLMSSELIDTATVEVSEEDAINSEVKRKLGMNFNTNVFRINFFNSYGGESGSYIRFSDIEKIYFSESGVNSNPRSGDYTTQCNIKNWSDPQVCVYISEKNSKYTITIKNPYYEFIYEPIKNWYNEFNQSTNISSIIDKEYKWCLKSEVNSSKINLVCQGDNYLQSDFGLLSYAEYVAIMHIKPINTSQSHISLYNIYDEIRTIDDAITLEFENINELASKSYYHVSDNYNQDNLRPAIVIKGDTKVIDGNGTNEKPFVLEIK